MLDNTLLRRFSVFSEIPDEKLTEISEFGDLLTFDSNEIVCSEGDAAQNLYGVFDGEVELSLIVRDKILKADIQYEEAIQRHFETHERDIVVDIIEPGEIFGEISLYDDEPRSADAEVLEDSEVVVINNADFFKTMENKYILMNSFQLQIIKTLCKRLRATDDMLKEGVIWGFNMES